MGELDMYAIETAAEIVGITDVELFVLQVGQVRRWQQNNEE